MKKHVRFLEIDGRTIVLLGVPDRCPDPNGFLDAAVAEHQPDVLGVGLCDTHLRTWGFAENWLTRDIFTEMRGERAVLLLASLGFSAFTRRLGRPYDDQLGRELVAMYHHGQEQGLAIHTIDRDIASTFRRAWRRLSLWHRMILWWHLGWGLWKKTPIRNHEARQLAQEDPFAAAVMLLTEKMPQLTECLIDERAHIMAYQSLALEGKRVLILAGTGQLSHVAHYLEDHPAAPDDWIEKPRSPLRFLWPILLLLAIAGPVWYLRDTLPVGDMLKVWLLVNAVCVGVCTLLARAHPVSILAGMVAAPFSALNPVLKASTAAALAESFLRRPTVAEAMSLPYDLEKFSYFLRNPFGKILIVFFAATIGSFLGTWIGAFFVARLL